MTTLAGKAQLGGLALLAGFALVAGVLAGCESKDSAKEPANSQTQGEVKVAGQAPSPKQAPPTPEESAAIKRVRYLHLKVKVLIKKLEKQADDPVVVATYQRELDAIPMTELVAGNARLPAYESELMSLVDRLRESLSAVEQKRVTPP